MILQSDQSHVVLTVIAINHSRGCMSSAQRRIAYDTAPAFQQLQQKLASDGDGNVLHTVSKYSKGITEVLASAEEAGDESADTMSLYQERGLWELISLFFIDAASSDGFVPQDLSRWLQSNATSVYSGAANTPLPAATLLHLQEAALPETNPAYWRSFHKLVALGWISSALELLALHSAWLRWDGSSNEPDVQAQVSALEAVSLLLRRFPSLAGHGAAGAGGSRQFSSSAEYNKYRCVLLLFIAYELCELTTFNCLHHYCLNLSIQESLASPMHRVGTKYSCLERMCSSISTHF